MDRDLALVERFSALKVPFWARLFPVLGTKAFITVFCSWFSDVSDKPFFWKFYRWKLHALTYCMWGTSLFFVMMPAVPTTIYFTTANQDGNYNVYLMALALGYFALNSLFQFAMLTCLPKLVLKAYLKKHAAAPRVAGADSLRAGGMYQFDAVLGNLRDNFLGLNAFTHFASDPVAIRNAWVADATDNRALYGASKNSYRVLVRLVERTFAVDKARRRQTYAKRTGIEYVALVCLTFALLGRKDATRRIAAKSAVFTAAFLIFFRRVAARVLSGSVPPRFQPGSGRGRVFGGSVVFVRAVHAGLVPTFVLGDARDNPLRQLRVPVRVRPFDRPGRRRVLGRDRSVAIPVPGKRE